MEKLKPYRVPFFIAFVASFIFMPALCPMLFGAVLLYLGLRSLLFMSRMRKEGIQVSGVIMQYRQSEQTGSIPIVRFTTPEGQTIEEEPIIHASMDVSRLFSREKANAQVEIVYDPKEPRQFMLAEKYGTNIFALYMFVIAGVVFVTVSICWMTGVIVVNGK